MIKYIFLGLLVVYFIITVCIFIGVYVWRGPVFTGYKTQIKSDAGSKSITKALISRNGKYIFQVFNASVVIQKTKKWDGSNIYSDPLNQNNIALDNKILVMQNNGELVVSGNQKEYWSSKTAGKGVGPYTATLHNNGTLDIVDSKGTVIWHVPFPKS